jgi:hypothetical protein
MTGVNCAHTPLCFELDVGAMDGRFLPTGLKVPRQLSLKEGFRGSCPLLGVRENLAGDTLAFTEVQF